MRAAIVAPLVLAVVLAGCNTVRPLDLGMAPLGRQLELLLPEAPGYPERLDATQTVIGQYGERRVAFQAVLTLAPDNVQVVLTSAEGPRILTITWTPAAIVEDRTPLAPANLKGISILADIFLSLWPIEVVRAAMPAGVTVADEGSLRTVAVADRAIVKVETLEKGEVVWRQKLDNLDFGYSLTIITERGR